jgi:hypothetical protein
MVSKSTPVTGQRASGNGESEPRGTGQRDTAHRDTGHRDTSSIIAAAVRGAS